MVRPDVQCDVGTLNNWFRSAGTRVINDVFPGSVIQVQFSVKPSIRYILIHITFIADIFTAMSSCCLCPHEFCLGESGRIAED